jgi:hypothetical protein
VVNSQKISSWLQRNVYVLVIAFVLFLIGISWFIPPQENIFPLQRLLQEVWIVLLGIGSVPFYLAVLDSLPLAIIILIVSASLLSIVSYALWSRGWKGIALFFTLFLINTIIGVFVLGFGFGDGNLASTTPQLACEQVPPDGEGIRIQSYVLTYSDGGLGQYFFSSTKDGGKTWDQIGSVSYNFGISSCVERQRFGNTNYSIWTCRPETGEHPRPPVCPVG